MVQGARLPHRFGGSSRKRLAPRLGRA